MNPLESTPQILATTPWGWVVAKPPRWLTIPGRESPHSDSAPLSVVKTWLETEVARRVYVVHRLDRDTSGVMLFANSADSHRELNYAFEKHRIKKEYWALCSGTLRTPTLRVEVPIEERRSITQFEVRAQKNGNSWVIARPLTGRRHQIRIHLQSVECPIWGDTQYGGAEMVSDLTGSDDLTIGRVALHALQIELPNGEKFRCPPPEDFSAWLKFFGKTPEA